MIRLLPRDRGLLDIRRLGLSERDESTLERLLDLPHGMIVITGPTGSGKTTTLATMLSILNQPSRKILTIEDPVEYAFITAFLQRALSDCLPSRTVRQPCIVTPPRCRLAWGRIEAASDPPPWHHGSTGYGARISTDFRAGVIQNDASDDVAAFGHRCRDQRHL